MPRPNAAWQKKYGNQSKKKEHLLSGTDDFFFAIKILAKGVSEAEGIMLQMFKITKHPVLRLLDMDDMQLTGERIVKAYHEWSKNDYDKLLLAIENRDSNLMKFLGL